MRTHILRLVLIASMLLGSVPVASGTGTITLAHDAVAGLGVEARVSGFAAGQSYDFVVITTTQQSAVFPLKTDSVGGGSVYLPGTLLQKAGAYHAFIGSNGTRLSDDTSFRVLPDVIDAKASEIAVERAHIAADGRDASKVAVILRDKFGNPLAGRPVELISSHLGETVDAVTSQTDNQGVQQFEVRAQEAGQVTLRAMDLLSDTVLDARGQITADATQAAGGSYGWNPVASAYTQTPGYPSPSWGNSPYAAQLIPQAEAQNQASQSESVIADSFRLTVVPKSLQVGEAAKTLTIEALDKAGNVAAGYVGPVDVSSPTDPDASVPGLDENGKPGQISFGPSDRGTKRLFYALTFTKPGTQTLLVREAGGGNRIAEGQLSIEVTGQAQETRGNRMEILSPKDGDTVKTTSITVEGITETHMNVEIIGGVEKAVGDSGESGHFSIPVQLDPANTNYTLLVRDNVGNEATVKIVRDTEAPKITSVTFDPSEPEENMDVHVTVQTSPQLPSVVLKFDAEQYTLTEDEHTPGMYTATFLAPKVQNESLTVNTTVTAKDDAGNARDAKATFTVFPASLPKVDGVTVEVTGTSVHLRWNPLTGEQAEKYRIFVQEEGKAGETQLDTPDTNPEAIIGGLTSNTTYTFTVIALLGQRASKERSDPVTAKPAGIDLKVTPGEGTLLLEWEFPDTTALMGFDLEYGVEQGVYTEKRTLAPEMRAYTLNDLLSVEGLTYYIRLTPRAISGDLLQDLAATAQGSPLPVTGFHPGASAGFDANKVAPPNDLHSGAPSIPSSGIPPVAGWAALAITALACVAYLSRRRNLRQTQQFLTAMQTRYRG